MKRLCAVLLLATVFGGTFATTTQTSAAALLKHNGVSEDLLKPLLKVQEHDQNHGRAASLPSRDSTLRVGVAPVPPTRVPPASATAGGANAEPTVVPMFSRPAPTHRRALLEPISVGQRRELQGSQRAEKATIAGSAHVSGKWYDTPFQKDYDNLGVSISINPSKARIEQNFLGTSHEWGRLDDYAKSPEALAAFVAIFRELGPSPVLRIGGRSQELLREVPSDAQFDALKKLQSSINARFIIGLPLESGDTELARKIMNKAKGYLGNSILAFGLGNEPDMWDKRVGGLDRDGNFQPGFGNYLAHFHRTAKALTGCKAVGVDSQSSAPLPWVGADGEVDPARLVQTGSNSDGNDYNSYNAVPARLESGSSSGGGGGGQKGMAYNAWGEVVKGNNGRRLAQALDTSVIMGPSWHDLRISDNSLRALARTGTCYLREVTVHYYAYFDKGNARVNTILDEDRLRKGITKFYLLRKAVNDVGFGLRIAETNSANDGGRSGLSEVFGSALWTADITLEFARAGATGIHMHWGTGGGGGDPNSGGPAYTGVQTNYKGNDPNQPYPSVHAPWYGYLLYNEATKGDNVRFTYNDRDEGSTCPPSVKVWSLIGKPQNPEGRQLAANSRLPSQTLRIVVINKDSSKGCNVELRIPKSASVGHAELHWLKNTAGLESVEGITWRGQTHWGTSDGKLTGQQEIFNLKPSGEKGDNVIFKLPVPAGQAVLMVTSSG